MPEVANEWENHGIAVTFTQGGDPTASGENAVALWCRAARASLMHIEDRWARRKLWPRAMTHASYLLTLEKWKFGRVQIEQAVPFGCLCMVYVKSLIQEANKIEKVWKRGLALHPSAVVPSAYGVVLVSDDV